MPLLISPLPLAVRSSENTSDQATVAVRTSYLVPPHHDCDSRCVKHASWQGLVVLKAPCSCIRSTMPPIHHFWPSHDLPVRCFNRIGPSWTVSRDNDALYMKTSDGRTCYGAARWITLLPRARRSHALRSSSSEAPNVDRFCPEKSVHVFLCMFLVL